MWRFAAITLFWVGACTPALPSSEPLGSGPLAEREGDAPRHTVPRRRTVARAKAPPSQTAFSHKEDAGGVVELDAGVRDGGPASSADAGATSGMAEVPVNWPGEYVGEDVSEITSDAMPNRTDRDPKARTRIEQKRPTQLVVVIVDSASGNPMCSLDADVTGAEATLRPQQSCFGEEGSVNGQVRTGKARLNGNQLTVDMDVDLTLFLEDETASGHLVYHFTGNRR